MANKSRGNNKNDGGLSMPTFLRCQNVNMDQSSPIFPNGVIIEIISRLPLKSLTKCQLVCKDWRSLIHNHYFAEMHMGHTGFIHHWHNSKATEPNKTKYDTFSYKHGCNGLLLMMNNKDKKHCLWNPVTRRVLHLPDPHVDSHGFAFSFVPATKSYRIVSFYKEKNSGGELGCEVFTPGQSDNVWRRLDNFPEITNLSNIKKERVSVVLSGGAVHCIVVTKVGQETNIEIVSLDLKTENFTVNHFPKLVGQFNGWRNFWDVDWDGKLGIVDVVGQNLEVMELEDYKKQRWSEKKKITHLPFLKKDEGNEVVVVYPLFVRRGEIWFWLKDKKIFTYTIATGKCTDVTQSTSLVLGSKIYPYKPSLIGFEGMVPDTKLENFRPKFNLS